MTFCKFHDVIVAGKIFLSKISIFRAISGDFFVTIACKMAKNDVLPFS